ncbi:hypothetical protein BD408DRAFT_24113 [Parasitella parasitica]|nr:hypothetical protein BD408DRAFT_24113 [Parasitella parasitica]
MPPKRNLTPKQLSNSLSYVQKEAPFLARLKSKSQEKERAARKFENYEDGQDDDDYDELDGAQVVELDSKGREIFKRQENEEEDGDEDEDEDEDEAKKGEAKEPEEPAVDENGRLLFRKQKQISSKRKLQSIIDEEIKKSDKPSSKKKKKTIKSKSKPTSLLSFQQDDE